MICQPCKEAAALNRILSDNAKLKPGSFKKHPKDCGCPCMHRWGSWEKLFSVRRPNA